MEQTNENDNINDCLQPLTPKEELKEEQPVEPKEEQDKPKKSKSCYGVGQYKKKPKMEAAEAKRMNLAKARLKKQEKRANMYKFELSGSESDDEELVIKPDPIKKNPEQDIKYGKDKQYEELHNEILQLKSALIKRNKKKKSREKSININLHQPQIQQSQETEEQRRLREKVLMSFN